MQEGRIQFLSIILSINKDVTKTIVLLKGNQTVVSQKIRKMNIIEVRQGVE